MKKILIIFVLLLSVLPVMAQSGEYEFPEPMTFEWPRDENPGMEPLAPPENPGVDVDPIETSDFHIEIPDPVYDGGSRENDEGRNDQFDGDNGQDGFGEDDGYGRENRDEGENGERPDPNDPPQPVDCANVENGSAFVDYCGECVGGTTGKEPCDVPCPTTAKDLKKMFPNASDNNLKKLANLINKHARKYGIDTKAKLQHFLAQAGHETGGFNKLAIAENMNYTTENGLLNTFKDYFSKTDATKRAPADYIRNPEALGNYVYGGRMGNGNEASGDGYLYRGRGVFQLTGKSNYQAFQTHYNSNFSTPINLINNPSLLATNEELAVISAMWYYQKRVLNKVTVDENTNSDNVTYRINGGYNGKEDRQTRTAKAKQEIDCNEQSKTQNQ